MTYGTKGTLRPTKPAEDYTIETMERELNVIKWLSIVLMVVIAVTYWWFA